MGLSEAAEDNLAMAGEHEDLIQVINEITDLYKEEETVTKR